MKWLINTSERRVDNGERVTITSSHIVEADTAEEARCSYRKFPYEKIDSVCPIVDKKKKK